MEEKKSDASILYEHIADQLDKKLDLTSAKLRADDFALVSDSNPDRKFSKPHYHKIFLKVLSDKKIDARAYGMTQAIPSFKKTESDMGGRNSPAPASTKSNQPQIKTPKTSSNDVQQKEALENEIDDIQMKYTQANVGATIKGLYAFIKWRFPFLDDLDDEEKKDLADLWMPAFEKYVQGKYAIIAIPLAASIGILKGKVNEEKKALYDQGNLTEKQKKKAEKNFGLSQTDKEELK